MQTFTFRNMSSEIVLKLKINTRDIHSNIYISLKSDAMKLAAFL